jgi:hypothetical protein
MGKDSCIKCDKGKYWKVDSQCHDCEKGKYQDEIGTTSCKICPRGYEFKDVTGSASCTDGGWLMATDCRTTTEYLNESYVLDAGKSCECDPNEECDASRKYRKNNEKNRVYCKKCEKCPTGTSCSEASTSFDVFTVGHNAGFWRVPVCETPRFNNTNICEKSLMFNALKVMSQKRGIEQSIFQKCPFKKRCLGVKNSTVSILENQCTEGTDLNFALCAVCKVGWQKDGVNPCKKCTNASQAIQTSVVFSIIIGFVLGGVAFDYLLRKKIRRVKAIWLDILRVSKILLSFWQIATALRTSSPTVPWPVNLSQYYDSFNWVNVDLIDMTGLACGIRVTHATKLNFAIATIMTLIFGTFLAYLGIRFRLESDLRRKMKAGKLQRPWVVALSTGFDLVDNDDSHAVNEKELAALLETILCHVKGEDLRALENKWGKGRKGIRAMSRHEAKGIMDELGFCTREIGRSRFVKGVVNHHIFSQKTQMRFIRWTQSVGAVGTCTSIPAQLAFIIHTPISKIAFECLNCRWVGDRAYVKSNFATECYTSEYSQTATLAGIVIGFFSIGLPLIIAIWLFKERHYLYTPRVTARLGW